MHRFSYAKVAVLASGRTVPYAVCTVGSYRSKVGERVRPFLVTSVAVLVAMVKLVVRIGSLYFSGVGSHLSLI